MSLSHIAHLANRLRIAAVVALVMACFLLAVPHAFADVVTAAPGHVIGRVCDPAVAGLEVDVLKVQGLSLSLVASGTTGLDGSFDIPGLVQGITYYVEVVPSDPAWASTFWQMGTSITDAPIGTATVSGATPTSANGGGWPAYLRLRGTGSLAGVSRDPSGTPTPNVAMYLYGNGWNGVWTSMGYAFTGADGAFSFGNLPPGSYKYELWNAAQHFIGGWYGDIGSGATQFVVSNLTTTTTDLTLQRGATVSGVVHRSLDGAPVGGVGVALVPIAGQFVPLGATLGTSSGGDGTWSIGNVPPGQYKLHYRCSAWNATELDAYYPNTTDIDQGATLTVTENGTVTRDTTLTTGGSIVGTCRDGLSGTTYQSSPQIYRYNTGTSSWDVYAANEWGNADGSYEVHRLAPGVYRLGVGVNSSIRTGYSPDATTLAGAGDIPVAADQTVHADTTVYPLEMVAGTTTNAQTGATLGGIQMTLWSRNATGGWDIADSATTIGQEYGTPDGTYKFEGIQPGVYRLTATDPCGVVLNPAAPAGTTLADAQDILITRGRRVTFSTVMMPRHIWRLENSGTSASLKSVSFPDKVHGWAVGAGGTIIVTRDGGRHWSPQDSGVSGLLNSVCFADDTHGCAVGDDGVILVTGDGGVTWASQSSGTGWSLKGVSFADALHGWAVGVSGVLLRTTDGGQTWTQQSAGLGSAWLTGVSAVDASSAFISGAGDAIYHTTDGGTTWTGVSNGTDHWQYAVAAADATHAWSVGGWGTIAGTTDGGASWQPQPPSDSSFYLYAVTCSDCEHAWAVGQWQQPGGQAIFCTATGGTRGWRDESCPTGAALNAVAAADEDRAWAVGDGGTIIACTPDDVTPPTSSLSELPLSNGAGWNNSAVHVTVSASDDLKGSGVATTSCTVDGLEAGPPSGFGVDGDGVHTIRYWSTDASGNVESTQAATVRIDETAPDLSLDATWTYVGLATISATATDTLSGVAKTELKVDDGTWQRASTATVATLGQHTLYARAFDAAGNERFEIATFTVTAPTPPPPAVERMATHTSISVPSSVRHKSSLRITGLVTPIGSTGVVTVSATRLVGKTWRAAGVWRTTLSRSRYGLTVKPSRKGSWCFVARYSGTTVGTIQYSASGSTTRAVKVK